jgi:hypothetical protein
MKHVKYFLLLNGLFFISTDIFCSEKNNQLISVATAVGAGATAHTCGLPLGPSAMIASAACISYEIGSDQWKKYQESKKKPTTWETIKDVLPVAGSAASFGLTLYGLLKR